MKKIYTTLAVGVLCASACFAGITRTTETGKKVDANTILQHKATAEGKYAKVQATAKLASPAKANKAADDEQWEVMGTGQYTENIISYTLGIDITTFDVTVEKSTNTEGLYRIVNPYANAPYATDYPNVLTYDANTTNYMVIHAENAPYVWIEDFSTGYTLEDAEGGEISVITQAASMIAGNGYDAVVNSYPNCLGTIENGVISYGASFTAGGTRYSNFLVTFSLDTDDSGELNHYIGNGDGKFQIVLPGYEAPDPNANWEDVGTATYVDDIMSCLLQDVTPSTIPNVPLQKSKTTDGLYRLVNPYALWTNPYSDILFYDESQDYYIEFQIYNNYVWVKDFNTGMYDNTYGDIEVLFQCGYLCETYGIETVSQVYPDMFGVLNNNIITYPISFTDEGKTYNNILIAWGDTSEGYFGGNLNGSFSIELPDGNGASITSVSTDNDANAPVEYFNLQGVRVANPEAGQLVIKRQGSIVTKEIAR